MNTFWSLPLKTSVMLCNVWYDRWAAILIGVENNSRAGQCYCRLDSRGAICTTNLQQNLRNTFLQQGKYKDRDHKGVRVAFCALTRCFCDSQGQLNDTIDLQLLDDATPEDKDEYTVFLSNIKTFGKAGLNRQSLFEIGQHCCVVTQCDVPFTPAQVFRRQAMLPWICKTGSRSSQLIPVMSPTASSPLLHHLWWWPQRSGTKPLTSMWTESSVPRVRVQSTKRKMHKFRRLNVVFLSDCVQGRWI